MKRIFLLAVVLSLLLVSCSAKYKCPDGSMASNPNLCKAPAEVQEEQQPDLVVGISSEVRDILNKAVIVKSMNYNYKRVDKPLENIIPTWFKGIVVKRNLLVQTKVLQKNELDAVIFDTSSRTATGYCESRKYCQKVGNIGPVSFDEYYIKTPLDWAAEITSAEKISEERLFGRNIWKLKVNGGMVMWVETYYGVPLKIEKDGEVHEFQDPVFNDVTEAEVQFVEKDLT
ncbi:MAG: hypothetical protein AABX05_03220 [Nanoarchaeota archaeon]